jgi:hypothetical protein
MWSSSSVTRDSVRQGASSRWARAMRSATTRPPVAAVVHGVVQQRCRGADVADAQACDRKVGADDAALHLGPRCVQGS